MAGKPFVTASLPLMSKNAGWEMAEALRWSDPP